MKEIKLIVKNEYVKKYQNKYPLILEEAVKNPGALQN